MPAIPAVRELSTKPSRADPGQVDAGAPGGLGVASDGVDVQPEPPSAEQVRPDHQDAEDQDHDPGEAEHRGEHSAVHVGEQDQARASQEKAPILARVSAAGGATSPLPRRRASRARREPEHDDHHEHQDPAERSGQRAAGDAVEHRVLDLDRAAVAEHEQHDALPEQQATERDHERRQADPGDQGAVQRPIARATSAAGSRPTRASRTGGRARRPYDRADPGDEADGQVDLAEQQHEHLGHGQEGEHRRLHEQVDQVARGQEVAVESLEQDRDQDQAGDDRQHAGVAALDPAMRARGNPPARRRRCTARRGRHPPGRLGRLGQLPIVGSGRRPGRGASDTSRSDSPVVIRSTTIRWSISVDRTHSRPSGRAASPRPGPRPGRRRSCCAR